MKNLNLFTSRLILKAAAIFCFAVIFAQDSYAQTTLQEGLVLVSVDTPTDNINTYEFLMTNKEYMTRVEKEPKYANELQEKVLGLGIIDELTMDFNTLLVTLIAQNDVETKDLLTVVGILSPGTERFMPKN